MHQNSEVTHLSIKTSREEGPLVHDTNMTLHPYLNI